MKNAVMELFFGPLSGKKRGPAARRSASAEDGSQGGWRAGCSVGATAPQPPAQKESGYRFFPCYFLDM